MGSPKFDVETRASLLEKGALLHVDELPADVSEAMGKFYGRYNSRFQSEHIKRGFYLRLFYRFAKDTYVKISQGNVPVHARKHLLCNMISQCVGAAKHRGEPLNEGSLWDQYTPSYLETFVAPEFIDGHLSWCYLSYEEVVTNWLGKSKSLETESN